MNSHDRMQCVVAGQERLNDARTCENANSVAISFKVKRVAVSIVFSVPIVLFVCLLFALHLLFRYLARVLSNYLWRPDPPVCTPG